MASMTTTVMSANAKPQRIWSAPPQRARTPVRTTLLAGLLCCALPSLAAEFTVDVSTDSTDALPGDDICADAALHCSLRAAVQESNASAGADTIVLSAGDIVLSLAGVSEDAAASGDLDVTSAIAIRGAGRDVTRIDAAGLDRVFDVPAGGNLTLEALQFGGGVQTALNGTETAMSGGGLLVREGANAQLIEVTAQGNRARRNGAAIAVFGSVSASRVLLLNNEAEESFGIGGAVYIGTTAASLVIEDSEMRDNLAHLGGAIHSNAAAATIRIERSLLTGNAAGDGGALYANFGDSQWLLRNVTISDNHANAGGALFGDGANELRFEHCTITRNHATGPNGGGAIFDVRGSANPNFIPIELVNTIVSGNTQLFGRECNTVFPDVIVSSGGTLHAPGDACRMRAGIGDIATLTAGIAPLADNGGYTRTHALLPDSIAIDAALPAACASVDQRGRTRPLDGNDDGQAVCDIGAFEFADPIFAGDFDDIGRAALARTAALSDHRRGP